MTAHAKLSPSSSEIWMKCPGMPREAAGLPDESSVYAAEGTAAHALAEDILKTFMDGEDLMKASALIGQEYEGFEVTQEMADAVQEYLDYVTSHIEEDDDVRIEQRLELNDDVWGTADFVRYRPSTKHLLVVDYKHGAGVPVGVYENTQALIYTLMAIKSLDNQGIKSATIAIAQPRCGDEAIAEWEVDILDLLSWEEKILKAYEATLDPKAPLIPGAHCKKWCKVAATCPALKELAQSEAKADFDETNAEAIGESMKKIPAIEAHIKAVKEAAYNLAMQGQKVPGFKLVKKRPTRVWKDEAETIRYLKKYGLDTEDIHTMKLKSPAQIDKVVGAAGKKDVEDLWVKESSGTTLASEDDKRPEVSPGDPQNDFEAID